MSKLEFGQPFVIELKSKVVIGGLTIYLHDVMSEWSIDLEGNYEDGFSTYKLLLSDGFKKKQLTYMSQNMYYEYVSSFEWRKYTIEVVEATSDNGLKLVVWKNK